MFCSVTVTVKFKVIHGTQLECYYPALPDISHPPERCLKMQSKYLMSPRGKQYYITALSMKEGPFISFWCFFCLPLRRQS